MPTEQSERSRQWVNGGVFFLKKRGQYRTDHDLPIYL